ncbi:uncharacterized [Tachysurus ichikawai]
MSVVRSTSSKSSGSSSFSCPPSLAAAQWPAGIRPIRFETLLVERARTSGGGVGEGGSVRLWGTQRSRTFFKLLHLEEFVYVCLQSNDSETLIRVPVDFSHRETLFTLM